MTCPWGKLLPFAVVVSLGATACPPAARGAFIVIGDFSNGLDGWTPNDSSAVTVTTPANSVAFVTLGVSPTLPETDLDLNYLFPSKAKKLSFEITGLTTDPFESGVTPNAFNATILDGTGNPVLSTVDPSTDAYYIRDLTDGVTHGQAIPSVTFSPSDGTTFPFTVTVDVSSLVGQTDLIRFRLLGSSDPTLTNSSVSLADVTIQTNDSGGGGGGSAVPEPATVVLAGVGVLCLASQGWLGRRQGRKT
jgi:hypothetical protein